ncbi:MAG: hypothetical protein AAB539_01400 [Patescibacteria group bacterium]
MDHNDQRTIIKNRIADFIRREHQDPRLDVGGADLIATGILDSFFLIALTDFLEREFKIQLTADDLIEDNFRTLDSIADLVVRRTKEIAESE